MPVLAVVLLSFYRLSQSRQSAVSGAPGWAHRAGPHRPGHRRSEERLRAVPDDGRAGMSSRLCICASGRYGDAAHAYGEAARLLGETPKRLVGFGEATLMVNNGVVTDAVRGASERILQLEPGRIEARIWLILAMEQDGNLAGAVKAYRELLDTGPKGRDPGARP